MIKLYQFELSPFCDKIRRICHYKKIAYQTHEVTLMEVLTKKIRKFSPLGKLPVIEDKGKRISDSSFIAEYIEKEYGAIGPLSEEEKALVKIYEDWADESLYFYELYFRFIIPENKKIWAKETAKFDGWFLRLIAPYVLPFEMKKIIKAQGMGRKRYDQVERELKTIFKNLEVLLHSKNFLVGNILSLADISVFCQLHCIERTKRGNDLVAAFPRLKEYLKRVDELTRMTN